MSTKKAKANGPKLQSRKNPSKGGGDWGLPPSRQAGAGPGQGREPGLSERRPAALHGLRAALTKEGLEKLKCTAGSPHWPARPHRMFAVC